MVGGERVVAILHDITLTRAFLAVSDRDVGYHHSDIQNLLLDEADCTV